MSDTYLSSVKKQFAYYKLLGDKTFAQVSDDQLFEQINGANAIVSIVKHLWGNMLSRWTNFLTEDGEKPWRDREAEFEPSITTRAELVSKWEEGWTCLFEALDTVNANNIDQMIYIRNQGHTVTEAINRQLTHYAYHVGQIVFIGAALKGSDWSSLSIPKGESSDYNREHFSKPKTKQHFTDDLMR